MPFISGGGAGGVASVKATDTSIVVSGTTAAPTIATAALNVIAADHATAGDVAMNSHKITGLANGSAATDAAAFGQLPASPAVVQLYSLSLASPGTFDQASISGAYNDLILVAIIRGTDAGSLDAASLRFNNDSGASQYDTRYFRGSGSSVTTVLTTTTRIQIGNIAAGAASANYFTMLEILIPGYASTAWEKQASILTSIPESSAGTGDVFTQAGQWHSTAAINRVQLAGLNTANLATGSVLRIYGRT